jgi:hypothetical protein
MSHPYYKNSTVATKAGEEAPGKIRRMTSSSSTPYVSFAKILSSYHERYAEAGPSTLQLDSPMRHDAVLDEEGGLLMALMGAVEETCVHGPACNQQTR